METIGSRVATAPLQQWRAVCQERVTDARGRQRLKGSWWNILFSRHISIYLTVLFVWLGITANQVTVLMLIVGLASFVCAVPHSLPLNIVSVVLFLLFNILDCCDGEVARWTKKCSSGGMYLDYTAHLLCNAPLMAAASLHQFLTGQQPLYGLMAFMTLMFALWAYSFKMIVPAIRGKSPGLAKAGDDSLLGRRTVDRVGVMALIVCDPILCPMLIIGSIILSHWLPITSVIGAGYGLLASLCLSAMYFLAGFIRAKRLSAQ